MQERYRLSGGAARDTSAVATVGMLVGLLTGIGLSACIEPGAESDVEAERSGSQSPATTGRRPVPDHFGELLDLALDRGVPAISIWLRQGDAEPWSGSAGFADLETRTPATTGHAFHIASVTKLFTTVAALRLVDDGELALEDRLVDRLGAEVVGELPYADEITVRQLLEHTSGLYGTNNDPDYIRAWLGVEAPQAWSWTAQDFIDLAAQREPWGRPGEATRYGDLSTILLGRIVEEAVGRPLVEHVRWTLFEPLALTSAYFFSEIAPGAEPPAPTVHGYLTLSDDLRSLIDATKFPAAGPNRLDTTLAGERIDAAAAIVATAEDLGRFGDAVFRGDLLSDASRRWLLSVADDLEREPAGSERQGAIYAYRKPYGVLLTAEGDGPGGSHALLAYHPASDTVIAALVNSFGLGVEADLLLDEVAGAVLSRRF